METYIARFRQQILHANNIVFLHKNYLLMLG